MKIIFSTANRSHTQIDGRFWVTETHTFEDGSEQSFSYLAPQDFDYEQQMRDRAVELEAEDGD